MSEDESDELTPELREAFKTMLSWQTPECQRARQRMEEIRPQWDDLGSTLVTEAALTYKAFTGSELEPAAAGTDPSLILIHEGSAAQREAARDAFADVNAENALVLDVLRSLVAGAIDHLLAVGVLMMTFAPIRPTFSSARVLFEAGARTHTLSGAHIEPKLRVTRAANFRLEDLQQQKTDLTHTGEVTDTDALTEIQDEMDRLTAEGDRDCLTPQLSLGGYRTAGFGANGERNQVDRFRRNCISVRI